MAQDNFRIEITIDAADNTGAATSSASANMDAFERSVQKTQERLNKLNGSKWKIGLEAVDKATSVVNKVTSQVNKLVGKAWNITMGVVDKVTAPIRGVFNLLKNPILQAGAVLGVSLGLKDTIDTYSAFEATMSKVGAVSGATAAEMELLTEKAKQMGATTKFTATEAGEAFSYMAMAGWKTEDMMNGIEGIMSLAAASGESLATTSDIVTDALTAFGLTAKDAGHFSDVLAAASSNANTNVSMMGETFKYAGTMAGTLGYSIEDTALAIGLMANAGIKSSQAGTELNNIFTRLSVNTNGARDAIESLGISFFDSTGTARPFADVLGELRVATAGYTDEQKTNIANAIAGQRAQAGLLAMLNATSGDYYKLTKAIQGADGAAKGMQDRMQDNLSGAITIFQSAMESVKLTAGERISPYLREFVGWMTGKMPELGNTVDRVFDKIDAKISETRQTIQAFTSTDDWANADLFEKIHIAWDKLIAEPFENWWSASGCQWFVDKSASIGRGIGSGVTQGLLALLGIDLGGATEDGVSVGGAFVQGLKESFDLKAIGSGLLEWASENKGLAIAAGSLLGLNLVSGLASKAGSVATLFQMLNTPSQGLASLGSALTGGGSATASTVTVNGAVVNVYGAGAGLGSSVPGLPGSNPAGAAANAVINTSWTGAHGAVGRFLQRGSTGVTVAEDGTLLAVQGGVGGTLGGVGTALGTGATTAAGAALAGTAAIAGIVATGASAISGFKDIGDAIEHKDKGDTDAMNASGTSGLMKLGGVGAGALAGAAIGSVVPIIGTGIGAAVGAGIGGIAGWIGGNKVKEKHEKEVVEAAKLEAIAAKEAAEAYEQLSLEQTQARYSSQALKDALADTTVSAEEFSKMFDRTVAENIHTRFGDIRLDATEISALVTDLIRTVDYDGLTAFERAKASAEDALQSMRDSMQELDKLNWKIGLGLELDETELSNWKRGMEAVYRNAKDYVENAHWEASAAITLLVDAGSEADFSPLDTAYAQINERLNALGEEYSAHIRLAMEDGVITLDEQAEIQSLQEQITSITDKVSSIEATAEMKALQVKYSGASLDYDSFTALQQELETQVQSLTASYDEALKVGIASLELQLSEGVIDKSAYDAQLQALAEGYRGKISAMQLEVENFQLESIAGAYETELDRVLPELEGSTAERLQQALNAALAADIDVAGLSTEQVMRWLGLGDSLAKETQEEISRLLRSVAETLPDNMTESIAAGFDHAKLSSAIGAGLQNGAVNPVLQEITARLSTGAAMQDYSATGAAVLEATALALANADRAPINGAVNGVYNDTSAALQYAFAQGFTTDSTVRLRLNYQLLSSPAISATTASTTTADWHPSYMRASGGFTNGPELSWIGEDGPEAIIPLGAKRRNRGLELYQQVGEILGVSANAEGGVYGYAAVDASASPVWTAVYSQLYQENADGGTAETPFDSPISYAATAGGRDTGGMTFEIHVDQDNEIHVDGSGMDEEQLIAAIREHSRENADELAGEIAKQIARALANTPVKGRA